MYFFCPSFVVLLFLKFCNVFFRIFWRRCYQLPINTVPQNSMCVDQGSDDESWRSDVSSCISCSSPPLPLYGNHSKRPSKSNHLTSRSWNKRRSELSQRHTSLVSVCQNVMVSLIQRRYFRTFLFCRKKIWMDEKILKILFFFLFSCLLTFGLVAFEIVIVIEVEI